MRLLLLFVLVSAFGCRHAPAGGPSSGAAAAEERRPAVSEDHPLFSRVEGEGFANDCLSDDDCHVGGCSGEICSAEEGVMSTCELRPWPQGDARCGCVASSCRWYHPVRTD